MVPNYEQRMSRSLRDALDRYRIVDGRSFALDEHATDDVATDLDKGDAKTLLACGIRRLADLQEKLYASQTWAVLVVLQGMDASGKDSTIKHVMSGINPQGVSVTSFKAPNQHELAHDFLWRIVGALPARGMIGIFNRSHYEDVLIARVHPELLAAAHLPSLLVDRDDFWDDRLADIRSFEAYLARQGVLIVKIFLNLGRDKQKRRLQARLDRPEKSWKIDVADFVERARWPDYRHAYQAAISATATPTAPWYVVPADRKWYARVAVAEAIIEALERLKLKAPELSKDRLGQIDAARSLIEAD